MCGKREEDIQVFVEEYDALRKKRQILTDSAEENPVFMRLLLEYEEKRKRNK